MTYITPRIVMINRTTGSNYGHLIYCYVSNMAFWAAEGYEPLIMVK